MLKNLLEERAIPALCSADQARAFFSENVYGRYPDHPARGVAERIGEPRRVMNGKTVLTSYTLSFAAGEGVFSFPFDLLRPVQDGPVPVFVYVSFRPLTSDWLTPFEEIMQSGYAVATFCHNSVTTDTRDTRDGLLALLPGDARNPWGKIGAWAYAASRLVDALCDMPAIDPDRIGVIGHSRLGKTALWCGVNDARIALTACVQSGCGGAALNRGKVGEQLIGMAQTFPDWFCGAFPAYTQALPSYPIDQHALLAAIAPRHVYLSSATEDTWADPDSEYLSLYAAAPAFGKAALDLFPHRLPTAGDGFSGVHIGYHLRAGIHALCREDWLHILAYRRKYRV